MQYADRVYRPLSLVSSRNRVHIPCVSKLPTRTEIQSSQRYRRSKFKGLPSLITRPRKCIHLKNKFSTPSEWPGAKVKGQYAKIRKRISVCRGKTSPSGERECNALANNESPQSNLTRARVYLERSEGVEYPAAQNNEDLMCGLIKRCNGNNVGTRQTKHDHTNTHHKTPSVGVAKPLPQQVAIKEVGLRSLREQKRLPTPRCNRH